MPKMTVELSWPDDMGEGWMNIDNLKMCLYSVEHVPSEILEVELVQYFSDDVDLMKECMNEAKELLHDFLIVAMAGSGTPQYDMDPEELKSNLALQWQQLVIPVAQIACELFGRRAFERLVDSKVDFSHATHTIGAGAGDHGVAVLGKEA